MPVCRKCGMHFPTRICVGGICHNLNNRSFCPDCSPIGGHNTRKTGYVKPTAHTCIICGKSAPRKRKFCTKNGLCKTTHVMKIAKENNKRVTKETLRRYLLLSRPHVCARCGFSEWLENPIPLESHHIDGNNNNNEDQNLELLCPNCHVFTDTYKGKNRGNGRDRSRNKGVSPRS
jgi:predicted nucleic acid-binding Zn ribbon protein